MSDSQIFLESALLKPFSQGRIYEGSVFSPLTAALTDKLVTNKLVTKCLKAGRLVNRTSFWNNA